MLDTLRPLVHRFAFRELFNELGWDHSPEPPFPITLDDQTLTLTPLARKRGVHAFLCPPLPHGSLPPDKTRRRVEAALAKAYPQNLVVFHDADLTQQRWLWVRREPGRPDAQRSEVFRKGETGQRLLQKLRRLFFSLQEEESITHLDVASRLRAGFDIEPVTKKFYTAFRTHADTLASFITGLPTDDLASEYRLILLNRLMFLYFIQKQGFLNNDPDYLRTLLARSPQGQNRFYRDAFRPLCFDILAVPVAQRSPDAAKPFGRIPYLNGGLFQPHAIELAHPDLDVPDDAFARIFAFFDAYQWHLDERPLRNDHEINPDVLGYIFEKYINDQAAMGAYYTKEDVTGYICRNTILPFLLERLAADHPKYFQPTGRLWSMLAGDPARYIYPDVRKGILADDGSEIPAPEGEWHTPRTREEAAAHDHALPTETRREYDARRRRCLALRDLLAAGSVHTPADLITHNLDIERFIADVAADLMEEEAPLLLGFWERLTTLTVLDPTCGSGAFLFAALNLLEPLYTTLLERMRQIVADNVPMSRVLPRHLYHTFGRITHAADAHPSERYFIHKSIILHNLFGVDLMPEAVETCKLRLFLKLIAGVDSPQHIEPLPDIDFNIRPGNTLVGYATRGDTFNTALFAQDDARRIEDKLRHLDTRLADFRTSQLATGDADTALTSQMKHAYRTGLADVARDFDRQLAKQYGIDPDDALAFNAWRKTHRPFHWYAEFHGVMADDQPGFDCIVGNPPYRQMREIKDYSLIKYETAKCGNIYAPCMERAYQLNQCNGRQGLIVPVSSVSTDGYATLQRLLRTSHLHYSSYDDRPSKLFDQLEHIRLSIHLIGPDSDEPEHASTRYNKWFSIERDDLFRTISYCAVPPFLNPGFKIKISEHWEWEVWNKLALKLSSIWDVSRRDGPSVIFYSRKFGYFTQVLDFVPEVRDARGNLRPPSEFKEIRFDNDAAAATALCALNSNLCYWYVTVVSDCRHLNKREVEGFPINVAELSASDGDAFLGLADELMQDLRKNSEMRKNGPRGLTIQNIIPGRSKPIIDRIDDRLAEHYGFTAEELDYIKNYDIKYRLGLDAVA